MPVSEPDAAAEQEQTQSDAERILEKVSFDTDAVGR
jgi:hypothetical protein